MALRSTHWFGLQDRDGFIHRSWMKNQGFPPDLFDGRPVIGICNTFSELTPCNAHLRQVAERVKRGVYEAGGFPLEFPVMSLGETNIRPTAMLFRNLASMDVEESIRANPIDGLFNRFDNENFPIERMWADTHPETFERVQRIITDTGYAPNFLARSLTQGRSHALGVVAYGLDYFGPSRILTGIEQEAADTGYRVPQIDIGDESRNDRHDAASTAWRDDRWWTSRVTSSTTLAWTSSAGAFASKLRFACTLCFSSSAPIRFWRSVQAGGRAFVVSARCASSCSGLMPC